MQKTSLTITITNIPKQMIDEIWEDSIKKMMSMFKQVAYASEHITINLEDCCVPERVMETIASSMSEHLVQNAMSIKGEA